MLCITLPLDAQGGIKGGLERWLREPLRPGSLAFNFLAVNDDVPTMYWYMCLTNEIIAVTLDKTIVAKLRVISVDKRRHMEKKNGHDLRFQLDERDIVWQVTGFAIVGVVATAALAIYSGTDNVPFRFLDVATSKLSWAFVPTLAFVFDWSRDMFRTKTEIREAARQKVREEGAKEEGDRIRELLKSDGVVLPPDVAEEIFNHKNGKA